MNNNELLLVNAIDNLENAKMKLKWAKENFNEDMYAKIEKSYKSTLKYTVIFVILLAIVVLIIFSFQISGIDKYSSLSTRTGHVSNGNIWYIQNTKHEIKLSDYGYDYTKYKDGDEFTVFLDKNNEVSDIKATKEIKKVANRPWIIMVATTIGMILVMVCVYIPICYNTFGKNWRKFAKWFEKANLSEDQFSLD